MDPKFIHLNDWLRILIGELPTSYFVEIIIRIAFVFLLLTVSMRLMGKRMAAQLSRNELAAQVSLAAAIGMPVLAPDRGLLPAVVIAIVIVATERLISRLSYNNQRFEAITQDEISNLINDGVMQFDHLRGARISRERLMAQIRAAGLFHLGQIKRLYIESSGSFTLIEEEKPKPGLSVIPLWDNDFAREQKHAPGWFVCNNCGKPEQISTRPTHTCSNCGDNNWVEAIEK
jgi:uncharacterized membrane protein YcaP (DUF421 family)